MLSMLIDWNYENRLAAIMGLSKVKYEKNCKLRFKPNYLYDMNDLLSFFQRNEFKLIGLSRIIKGKNKPSIRKRIAQNGSQQTSITLEIR
jgi:hypothetical protein